MATVSITRGNTLPNSSQKADFHNLIDQATGSVSNIVNADIDSSAAIADTKLAQITTADKVSISAVTKSSNLTTVTAVSGDYVVISDTSDSGNNKKALVSDIVTLSTFSPSASNALTGSVVQVVNTQTGAVSTGTTTIPDDDTIPQITEGNQILSRSITPTNASNTLIIDVLLHVSVTSDSVIQAGLFQDATANTLAAGRIFDPNATVINPLKISFTMTAGTTSLTTFTVRAGGTSGTTTFNGISGARKLGGVLYSSIIIKEIKA